jgi:hypothetical protein
VSAYERFLDDDSLYGRVLECSAEKQFFLEPPTLANGHVSRRAVTVWDPLFRKQVLRFFVDYESLANMHAGIIKKARDSPTRFHERALQGCILVCGRC